MIDDEKTGTPPDAVFEKVRRKMVRLLAISIAVLFVGLIAVLSAVVYRTKGEDGAVAGSASGLAAGLRSPIELARGARLAETSLDGDTALLRAVLPDDTQELLLLDLVTGRVVARYPIGTSGANEAMPSTPTP